MLGVALGAAVNSGLDTYSKLQLMERQKMQNDKLKAEQEGEQALQDALKDQTAKDYVGGTATGDVVKQGLNFNDEQKSQLAADFQKMTPEQQQTALRAYSKAGYANEGYGDTLKSIGVYEDPKTGQALATSQYKNRSTSDRIRGAYDQMLASGNTYGINKAAELYKTTREMERTMAFDNAMQELQDTQLAFRSTAAQYGLSGVPEHMKDQLKKAGLKAMFKKGKEGGALYVETTNGEAVGKFTDPRQVENALKLYTPRFILQKMLPFSANAGEAADIANSMWQQRVQARQLEQGDRQIGIAAMNAQTNRARLDHQMKTDQRDFDRSVFESDRLYNQQGEQFDKELDYKKRGLDSLDSYRQANTSKPVMMSDGSWAMFSPMNGKAVPMPGAPSDYVNAGIKAGSSAKLFANIHDGSVARQTSTGLVDAASGKPVTDVSRYVPIADAAEYNPIAMYVDQANKFIAEGYGEAQARDMANRSTQEFFGASIDIAGGRGQGSDSRGRGTSQSDMPRSKVIRDDIPEDIRRHGQSLILFNAMRAKQAKENAKRLETDAASALPISP